LRVREGTVRKGRGGAMTEDIGDVKVRFVCQCGRKYSADPRQCGHTFQCQSCGRRMVIPKAGANYDGSLLSAVSVPVEPEPKYSEVKMVPPANNDARPRKRTKLWIGLSVASLFIIVLVFYAGVQYGRGSLTAWGNSETKANGEVKSSEASESNAGPKATATRHSQRKLPQSGKESPETASQSGVELSGKDLLAWKVAWQAAVQKFNLLADRYGGRPGLTVSIGPAAPKKRLMMKTPTGDYVFSFLMNLGGKSLMQVTVTDYGTSMSAGSPMVSSCTDEEYTRGLGN